MSVNTSEKYKTAIKADTELTAFEASFGFIPDGARDNADITSSGARAYSDMGELNDDIHEPLKYATLEEGRWRLDATFDLINPDDGAQQIGYMSDKVCDENGCFADPPQVIYSMNTAYDIIGVTLFFDTLEWATDLTIEYYSDTDVLIQSAEFKNDKSIVGIEYPCVGVKKIIVKINKWSTGCRFVKVCEILPGEVFIFDGDSVFSFEYYDTITLFDTAIELPEFRIRFDNSSRKFDILNPSGLGLYLRQFMKISARLGLLTDIWEYVPMGEMYLYSWPTSGGSDESEFLCKPALEFKTETADGSQSDLNVDTATTTLEVLAAKFFEVCGIDNYSIHESLKGVPVNAQLNWPYPLKEIAGHIAVAAGGYWHVERDGSYTLMPIINNDTANDTLTFDELWQPPDIEQITPVTSVNLKWYECTYEDGHLEVAEKSKTLSISSGGGISGGDIDSIFIPTKERATEIGNMALEYFNRRLKYSVSYRGDMSIEAGDTVDIQNDYGIGRVFITSHSVTWDESNRLTGSLEGTGR